ncbi:MAG TPA: DUF4249 domain-containing protein [Flavobacteriales bacterium]|nr:DUF4249 domain-containing protein [Flavobacteriales bacterium]
MNNQRAYLFLICSVTLWLISCEKEITIDLPNVEDKLVVEGKIEYDGITNTPPIVILTKSTGYFEPTDLNSLQELFVHGADVTVTVDNVNHQLTELCLSDILTLISSGVIDSSLVEDLLGASLENLIGFEYCLYTIIDNSLYGEPGKTYKLTITTGGKTYTSTTSIPALNPLISVWYLAQKDDTLGFAWARMHDPPGKGNAYRWYARRISKNADGEEKDAAFVAPFGSSFEDKFIDGLEFDFAYDRGHPPGNHDDDPGEAPHFFKQTDTIAIKFCTIEMQVYEFLRIMEVEANSNGSPFASPSTIPTNIDNDGLGLWAGYGVTYDTIYGTP